jgi:hypothetical protein
MPGSAAWIVASALDWKRVAVVMISAAFRQGAE